MRRLNGYILNTSTVTVEDNITTEIQISLIPCVSNWQCEHGLTGYDIDGCDRRRTNPICITKGNIDFISIPAGADMHEHIYTNLQYLGGILEMQLL